MAEYFSTNLKHLREQKGLSQNKLGAMIGVNQTTIARWEDDNRVPTIDNAIDVAYALNVSLTDLLGKDLRFDNAQMVDIETNTVRIPVLGVIKAGIPIEAQQNIIDYIEIPKQWTLGGKYFYGLKVSGDSMSPKYNDNDIVIFEQNNDYNLANNKDCAVMVNGNDATFKKVKITENALYLQPYNINYDTTDYSKEQIENLPVRIIGIAREKRTKINWDYSYSKKTRRKNMVILIWFVSLIIFSWCYSTLFNCVINIKNNPGIKISLLLYLFIIIVLYLIAYFFLNKYFNYIIFSSLISLFLGLSSIKKLN